MRSNYNLIIPLPLLLFFSLFSGSSCTHEVVNFDQLDTVCFENQILPLIQNSCGTVGCHDAGSGAEGFVAANYASILQAVKPGDPKGSKLYNVITDIWGEHFMPPDNPLPISDRNLIQLWIAQGAMETTCDIDTNGGIPGPVTDPFADSVCFVQDIQPIFQSSCATTDCHDALSHQEDYNLTSYTSIMSSEGIDPFNPSGSKIYRVITDTDPDDRMPPPPRSALTADQIASMQKWILEGALNSDCPQKNCDTLSIISFSNQVFPFIQNNCLSCHNSTPANGGVLLNNYANVKAAAETLRNGTPLIVGAIRRLNGFSAMPPDYQVDNCSMRIIELWIEQGKQNN
ncbi:MAG: hypothetical protein JXJ22_14925 [Bacteroidales bacterium]|nr:hypothetical protein [Bacteroidales bacterium]